MVTPGPGAAERSFPESFPARILALLLEAAGRGKRGLLQEDATAALRWTGPRGGPALISRPPRPPRSKRLYKTQKPCRSHTSNFARSRRRPMKTKT